MSAGVLFIVMLIIGISLTYAGSKSSDKTKTIIILLGVVVILIAAFGIFTSLL